MNKAPSWFTILVAIAIVWNLIGAFAVIMNFMITPEALAALPPQQQQMYADSPKWASYASLLAVTAGAIGCAALLFKQAWSELVLIISLLGLVVQNIGLFVLVDAVAVMGISVLLMQGVVALIAIGLIFLAKYAKKQPWFN